ncbi:MAG: class I SAM-dependent methyltransferase [Pyrinomonadaceae bacterium]
MIIAPRQKRNLTQMAPTPASLYSAKKFFLDIYRLYDRAASAYSRDAPKFRDDLISRPLIVELAKSHGYGKRIVDVGCGDGHISRLISTFAETVVGVDLSASMLNEAYRKSGLFKNVQFLRGNFLNLESTLPNQKFDVALGIFAFCCVKNLNQLDWAFRSIYQVLEKNATAIIQIPDERENLSESSSQWIEDSPYSINEVGQLVNRRLKAIDDSWVDVARFHYRKKDYLNSISKAGFRIEYILEPKATSELVNLHPSLKHEAEVSSSLILILKK